MSSHKVHRQETLVRTDRDRASEHDMLGGGGFGIDLDPLMQALNSPSGAKPPEWYLLAAILIEAYECATQIRICKPHEEAEDLAWFEDRSKRTQYLHGFEWCCAYLGLEPEAVRRIVRTERAKSLQLRRPQRDLGKQPSGLKVVGGAESPTRRTPTRGGQGRVTVARGPL